MAYQAFRDDIHRVLTQPIVGDDWNGLFQELSIQGRIDQKTLMSLFIVLAEHLEALEGRITSLEE